MTDEPDLTQDEIDALEIAAADVAGDTEADASPDEAETPSFAPPVLAAEPVLASSAPVSGAEVDDVVLARIIFKNKAARKSLSVHHVQQKLGQRGYMSAWADKDGWYGDLTSEAVVAFQTDNGLDAHGTIDAVTLVKLFEGDAGIRLVI